MHPQANKLTGAHARERTRVALLKHTHIVFAGSSSTVSAASWISASSQNTPTLALPLTLNFRCFLSDPAATTVARASARRVVQARDRVLALPPAQVPTLRSLHA
eukprot:2289829-Pleurochrysis_carterae.AAC.1